MKSWNKCLICGKELADNHCDYCGVFNEQYCIGVRTGVMKDLINIYKYDSVRAASWVLADVVSSKLSGSNGILVPLPTVGRHIRERGYDHIKMIVKNTGLPYRTILQRKNNAVQVGASAEKRREQAKTAYVAKHAVNPETEYILFDDVWTTGSSLLAAREVIIKAGAQKVSVAVLAKTVH